MEMLKELAKEDKFAAVQLSFLDHVTCDQRLAEVQPKIISPLGLSGQTSARS